MSVRRDFLGDGRGRSRQNVVPRLSPYPVLAQQLLATLQPNAVPLSQHPFGRSYLELSDEVRDIRFGEAVLDSPARRIIAVGRCWSDATRLLAADRAIPQVTGH